MSGRHSEPLHPQHDDARRETPARRSRGPASEPPSPARGGASAELNSDAVVDGRYRILRRPSRWVVGNAYPAHDATTGEPVVVVLPEIAPDQAAGFVQRARVDAQRTRALQPHHVVTIRDCGVLTEGLAWFTIRRVAGTSLLRHLKAQGALGTDVALHLFEKLCEQVTAAHASGLVLGDLRPANIILAGADDAPEGEGLHPEVVDMGFARGVFDGLLELPAPPVAYRSPERRRGMPLTPADDVYALGAVLYFMLTARPPVADDAEHDRPIPAPSLVRPDLDLSAYVDRVVLRALAPRPEERHARIGDLLEAVRGLRELFRLSPAAREMLKLGGDDVESRVDAFESDPTAEFGMQALPRLMASRRPRPATAPMGPPADQAGTVPYSPAPPVQPTRATAPSNRPSWQPPPPEWQPPPAGSWPPPGSVPPPGGVWPPATGQQPVVSPSGPLPPVPFAGPPAAGGPFPPPAWSPAGLPVEPTDPGLPARRALPGPTGNLPALDMGGSVPGRHGRVGGLGMAPLRLEAEPGRIAPAIETTARPAGAGAGRWIASVVLVLLVFGGVIAVAWTLQGSQPSVHPPDRVVQDPAAFDPLPPPQPAVPAPAPTPVMAPPPADAPAPVVSPASVAAPPSSAPRAEAATAPEPTHGSAVDEDAPPEGATPPAPGSVARVRLQLATVPAGARVVRAKTGEVPCAATPCVLEHQALEAGKVMWLRIEKAGFASREVYLPVSADGEFSFELHPAAPPAPAEDVAPPAAGNPPTAAPSLRDPFGD